MKIWKMQKGYLPDLNLLTFSLFIGISACFFLIKRDDFVASNEELKEVNKVVELAKDASFAEEFNRKVKPYLDDGLVTKKDAKNIIKEYELLKLKQNTVTQE